MPATSESAATRSRASGSAAASEAEESCPMPCRLLLPVVPAARVIGKGGANLKAIRQQSGADVRVLQKELPREMQAREDRVVVIEAEEADAVRAAIGGVLERVFDLSGLPESVRASRNKERPHVVELLVPEKSGAHFIGQRGERIRSLIEETGCDINIGRDPVFGFAEQKKVRVTGASTAEASAAVCRLQEVLAELASGGVLRPEHFELREAATSSTAPGTAARPGLPRSAGGSGLRETPVRVLVSKDEAAWIVGKKGNKIMRLRDHARVNLNDADSPPFDPTERVLEITAAPLERRMQALQMALEDLALRDEASAETRMLVPTRDFGSLMGHRGETMRAIMAASGAQLQQHKAELLASGSEYHLRLVEVRGDLTQRCEAARMAHEALEERSSGTDAVARSATAAAPSRPRSLGASDAGAGAGAGSRSAGRLIDAGMGGFGAPTPKPATASSRRGPVGMLPAAATLLAAPPLPAPPALDTGQEESGGALVSLQLAMPSDEIAQQLASDASGVAWRAGVKLSVERGPGGLPILQSTGTAVGNSVACYLIQDRLFTMH